MRKPDFCKCENKDADQLRGNREVISAFVFATRIVQSLYFLNPKFQASSYLLWLYSPVSVGPGLNLNLNSLLVKRQIDNPSPGAVTGGN